MEPAENAPAIEHPNHGKAPGQKVFRHADTAAKQKVNREYQQAWRDQHRQELRDSFRQKHRAKRLAAGSAVMSLDDARNNPERATRLGICLKCGGLYPTSLHLHVSRMYGLSKEGYLTKFNLPLNLSLKSDRARAESSEGLKRFYRTDRGRKIASHSSRLNTGRPRPDLRGRTGKRKLKGPIKSVTSWEIAKRLTAGTGLEQAAKELGMDWTSVRNRAKRMGLAIGAGFLCDQGETFGNSSLVALRKVSDFTAIEFAKSVGLSRHGAMGRRGNPILRPVASIKVLRWRDAVVRALLSERSKKYRHDSVVKTFFPRLPLLNQTLLQTFSTIRDALQENVNSGWTAADVAEFVCNKSQFENSQHLTVKTWLPTLRYFWQIESAVDKNIQRLRGAEPLAPIVYAMIGSGYGASARDVENALRGRTNKIPPTELYGLILAHLPQQLEQIPAAPPEAPPTGNRPARHKRFEETDGFQAGRLTEEQIRVFEAIMLTKAKLPRRDRQDQSRCAATLEERGYSREQSVAASAGRNAREAARWFVSITSRYAYDSVATHHREYRRWRRKAEQK